MRKLLITFLFLSVFVLPSFAQQKEKVRWLSWEQAISESKKEKKKIIVDVYTDWCGWCKHMDKTTYEDDFIVNYLNENYYVIKFNAEQQADIKIGDKVYKFVKQGRSGYHELAAEILQGQFSYPTTVFLDEDFNMIQPISSYLDPAKFEQIITYFGKNNLYKKVSWAKYEKEYKPVKVRN